MEIQVSRKELLKFNARMKGFITDFDQLKVCTYISVQDCTFFVFSSSLFHWHYYFLRLVLHVFQSLKSLLSWGVGNGIHLHSNSKCEIRGGVVSGCDAPKLPTSVHTSISSLLPLVLMQFLYGFKLQAMMPSNITCSYDQNVFMKKWLFIFKQLYLVLNWPLVDLAGFFNLTGRN